MKGYCETHLQKGRRLPTSVNINSTETFFLENIWIFQNSYEFLQKTSGFFIYC